MHLVVGAVAVLVAEMSDTMQVSALLVVLLKQLELMLPRDKVLKAPKEALAMETLDNTPTLIKLPAATITLLLFLLLLTAPQRLLNKPVVNTLLPEPSVAPKVLKDHKELKLLPTKLLELMALDTTPVATTLDKMELKPAKLNMPHSTLVSV